MSCATGAEFSLAQVTGDKLVTSIHKLRSCTSRCLRLLSSCSIHKSRAQILSTGPTHTPCQAWPLSLPTPLKTTSLLSPRPICRPRQRLKLLPSSLSLFHVQVQSTRFQAEAPAGRKRKGQRIGSFAPHFAITQALVTHVHRSAFSQEGKQIWKEKRERNSGMGKEGKGRRKRMKLSKGMNFGRGKNSEGKYQGEIGIRRGM